MDDLSILVIIWISVFISAWLAEKTRLTPTLWYLFFGAALVNIDLLPEEMPIFIEDFADLGIIVIMFSLGFEEDTHHFIRSIKRSWGITLFGAIIPFLVAWSLTLAFWNDQSVALMSGLAMTATAVSLTMVSLKSENLTTTPAATGIMTSAVLDDIASLALVAILVPIATGEATVTFMGISWILAKAALFFGLVTILGAWLFPHNQSELFRNAHIASFQPSQPARHRWW